MNKLSLNLRHDIKTFTGLALTFACLVALVSLVGCAPEVKQREYPNPKTDFGPIQTDTDLGLDALVQKSKVEDAKLSMRGEFASARMFRVAEWMVELGVATNRKPLVNVGRKLSRAFYATPGAVTRATFESSLYASAAIGETRDDSLQMIAENDKMIANNTKILYNLAIDVGRPFPWPRKGASARELLDAAEAYMNTMLDEGSEKLDPRFFGALVKAMDTKFYPIIRDARLEVDSIFTEPKPLDIIRRVKDLAHRNDLDFTGETKVLVDKGERVFQLIENMRTRHDGLTVLVELWEMTEPADREKTFKPVSKDLYEYLDGKSASDLRCIKDHGCKKPFTWLAKHLVILPAIEEYGITKMRNDVRVAAREALVETIQEQAAELVPQLPDLAREKIVTEVETLRSQLRTIQKDYPGFVKGLVRDFAKEYIHKAEGGETQDEVLIVGSESEKVELDIAPGRINVRAKERSSSVVTGAETIGTSLALTAALWQADKEGDSQAYRRAVISQVNKLLAIGGFKTEKGAAFKSLALSLDSKAEKKHFYIRDFMSSKHGYAVPDRFRVAADFSSDSSEDPTLDVSVRGQAELLRGLSAMIRYFRDWEKNTYDESIGKIAIGELVRSLPSQSLTQKLFPKDMMFALAVGNAASILQNMQKTMSPVFIVTPDRRPIWANERTDNEEDLGSIAGIVDFKQGQRADNVNSGDIARFLIGIADFLDAVEGIERTQAVPLVEKDEEGKRPVDILIESKQELRLLAVGLANMLSHQMQAKDGGIRPSFQRSTVTTNETSPRTLRDQALAVMALTRVGEVLGKDLYTWAALDAFAFMNKTMWNKESGFYRSTEGKQDTPSLDETTMALLAGERLRLKMNEKSRAQWDTISDPWLKALEEL